MPKYTKYCNIELHAKLKTLPTIMCINTIIEGTKVTRMQPPGRGRFIGISISNRFASGKKANLLEISFNTFAL